MNRQTAIYVLATIFFMHRWLGAEEHPQSDVGPVASQRPEVADTLRFLYELESKEVVLSGQNLGHGNDNVTGAYYKYAHRLHEKSGHWPALFGVDYGYDDIPPFLNSANRILEKHFTHGGLVTVSMHPKNPWQNSEVGDREIGTYRELLTPGTRPNRNYRRQLDHVAKGLARLRDNRVVVLWRPFHEMNGGWFWWCPNQNGEWPSPNLFRALWIDLFRYFTVEKKLDNLIWVYAPAVQKGDGEKSAIEYYPGDKYVDVVGLDWYMDEVHELDRHGSYSQLAQLGKPMGLTEFGPLTHRDGKFDGRQLLRALEQYPQLTFFLCWHSWPGNQVALVDLKNGAEVMAHPRVLAREALSGH